MGPLVSRPQPWPLTAGLSVQLRECPSPGSGGTPPCKRAPLVSRTRRSEHPSHGSSEGHRAEPRSRGWQPVGAAVPGRDVCAPASPVSSTFPALSRHKAARENCSCALAAKTSMLPVYASVMASLDVPALLQLCVLRGSRPEVFPLGHGSWRAAVLAACPARRHLLPLLASLSWSFLPSTPACCQLP